ncbi:MAG: LPS-assembly protein LptD [Bdellovibrionales bacterium]|nr:LPS-assembly protein LptD [Bdellovibrionales bacterium]
MPLNSKRQTGFLVPRPGSTANGGLSIEQPFFWAIDRSHDATFSAINHEKRGWQGLVNYRYVISPTSGGEMTTAYLKDRAAGDNDRYFLHYKHYYKLPNDYTQRTQIAIASDRKYPREFPRQLLYNGEPALENSFSITKNFKRSHLSLEAAYNLSLIEDEFTRLEANQTILGETDPDPSFSEINKANKRSLHRLPEINYQMVDEKVSDDYNLFFNFDTQYINVTRNDIGFDSINYNAGGSTNCVTTDVDGRPVDDNPDICVVQPHPDGEFDYGEVGNGPVDDPTNQRYGDLIRTGQRLDMMAQLHQPFWVGKTIDADHGLSFRYTQYSLGVPSDDSVGYDSFPSRMYAQYDASVRTYFSRVFDWGKNEETGEEAKIKHSIIPRLNLKYIPQIHQTNSHFFGNTESLTFFSEKQPIDDTDIDWRGDGRGIQFDMRDRVIGRQYLTWGLTNKVVSRGLNDQSQGIYNRYQQNFIFDLSQSFDLFEENRKGGGARPWQDIQANVLFNSNRYSQSITANHFPYHKVTRWVTRSRYYFYGNDFVGINYIQSYNIEQTPPVDLDTKVQNLQFSTGMNFRYLYFSGQLEYDLRNSQFKAWIVRSVIRPPGSCWVVNVNLNQPLDQPDLPVNYSIGMEFEFGK